MIENNSNKSEESFNEYDSSLSNNNPSLKNASHRGNCVEYFKKAVNSDAQICLLHGTIRAVELFPLVNQITPLETQLNTVPLENIESNPTNYNVYHTLKMKTIHSNNLVEALAQAIFNNNIEDIEQIIEKGVDLNKPGLTGKTPLTIASEKGYIEICEILIKKGADVNALSFEGKTAFIAAILKGQYSVCQLLINNNARIDIRDFSLIQPSTALDYVMRIGSLDGLKLLMGDNEKLYLLLEKVIISKDTDFSLDSELTTSIYQNEIENVKSLFKCGVDFNKENDFDLTPLYIAVMCGSKELLQILLKLGANFDHLFIEAIEENDFTFIGKLIENRLVDLNQTNAKGKTPLIIASKSANEELFTMLIEAKVKVNLYDAKGNTALIWAASRGSDNIVKMLLDAGASVDHQNFKGLTAIISAVSKNDYSTYKVLRNAHANLSLQSKKGLTLLATAAWNGHNELLKKILKYFEKKNLEIIDGQHILFGLKGMRTEGYKEIFNKIVKLKPQELTKFKGTTLLKAISHSHELEEKRSWLIPLSNENDGINVRLGGGWSPFWFNKMEKATELLRKEHPSIMDEDTINELREMLLSAADFSSNNLESSLERISKNKPLAFEAGYSTHSVIILIWESYFIICNRGECSRGAIEVFEYDRKKLDLNILKKIVKLQEGKWLDYEELMFETLPVLLSFKENDISKAIEGNCPLLDQIASHCSWVSAETAVWAYLVIKQLRDEYFSDVQEIAEQESKKFMSWLVFNQLYHLERYMKSFGLINESKELKGKTSLKEHYKNHIDLIETAFESSYKKIPNEMIDPTVVEKRDYLYKIFQKFIVN